jgi:two-component sensor histidine kinase
LHSLTQAIFESQDFQAALSVALQKVCEATDWDLGEAWVPNADGSALECSPAWYAKSENLVPFRKASETFTFQPGIGIPGRVWLSKQPEWRRDVSSESNQVYLRAKLAQEAGLSASLGIPIIGNEGVLAVLVFYMFASNEANKLEFNPTQLNLEQFCRELVEDMRSSIPSHIILTFDCRGDGNNAYLDGKRLRQILTNLLSNAIKYSRQGGTVRFGLECVDDVAIFSIQDDGIGIPAADQLRLFESFHRASNVGMRPGTGLGLTIVKKCVDSQGGQITVDSVVGVGTKFTVTLPLKQPASLL